MSRIICQPVSSNVSETSLGSRGWRNNCIQWTHVFQCFKLFPALIWIISSRVFCNWSVGKLWNEDPCSLPITQWQLSRFGAQLAVTFKLAKMTLVPANSNAIYKTKCSSFFSHICINTFCLSLKCGISGANEDLFPKQTTADHSCQSHPIFSRFPQAWKGQNGSEETSDIPLP